MSTESAKKLIEPAAVFAVALIPCALLKMFDGTTRAPIILTGTLGAIVVGGLQEKGATEKALSIAILYFLTWGVARSAKSKKFGFPWRTALLSAMLTGTTAALPLRQLCAGESGSPGVQKKEAEEVKLSEERKAHYDQIFADKLPQQLEITEELLLYVKEYPQEREYVRRIYENYNRFAPSTSSDNQSEPKVINTWKASSIEDITVRSQFINLLLKHTKQVSFHYKYCLTVDENLKCATTCEVEKDEILPLSSLWANSHQDFKLAIEPVLDQLDAEVDLSEIDLSATGIETTKTYTDKSNRESLKTVLATFVSKQFNELANFVLTKTQYLEGEIRKLEEAIRERGKEEGFQRERDIQELRRIKELCEEKLGELNKIEDPPEKNKKTLKKKMDEIHGLIIWEVPDYSRGYDSTYSWDFAYRPGNEYSCQEAYTTFRGSTFQDLEKYKRNLNNFDQCLDAETSEQMRCGALGKVLFLKTNKKLLSLGIRTLNVISSEDLKKINQEQFYGETEIEYWPYPLRESDRKVIEEGVSGTPEYYQCNPLAMTDKTMLKCALEVREGSTMKQKAYYFFRYFRHEVDRWKELSENRRVFFFNIFKNEKFVSQNASSDNLENFFDALKF